jgi:hypothetical protein
VNLPETKPRLTFKKQFVIPEPYRAWCHVCERGFMSLEELTQHDRENINIHERKQSRD